MRNRIRTTAAIFALALAGAGCGSDGGDRDVPANSDPTTTTTEAAARADLEQVKARVRRALQDTAAFSAEVTEIYVPPPDSPAGPMERSFSLLATAAGDVRRREAGGGGEAYDAAGGTQRALSPEGHITERRGMAPGPPDLSRPGNVNELSRLLLDLDAAVVSDSTYEGEPAWVVQGRLRAPRSALLAEEVALTVDRAKGMVVRGVGTTNGAITMEVRLRDLVVDPPVEASQFAPPATAGAEVSEDGGFRRLDLEEVVKVAGYQPLVPTQLPEGYQLREVAFAERASRTGSDGHQNPPSRKVVSLAFHRGFDRIVVSMRLRGTRKDAQAWQNPTGYSGDDQGGRPEPERVTMAAGALEGASAEVVSRIPAELGRSQMWALGSDLVVTVWGDLDKAEALVLAESLRRTRPI